MQLPIVTSNLTLLAGRVEPVIDFETRQPRADANGEPVYGVDVVAFGTEAPQIWPVKISGQPRGVAVGQQITVTGLIATVEPGGSQRHRLPCRGDRAGGRTAEGGGIGGTWCRS